MAFSHAKANRTKLFGGLACALGLIAAPEASHAQPAPELGLWYNDTGEGAIETYLCGSNLCARIVWLKEPNFASGTPKYDGRNPDPSKRKRPICGLTTMWGLKRAAGGGWVDGQGYKPQEGKQYSISVRAAGRDTLQVTGSVLFFSKTVNYRRVKGDLERCDQVAAKKPDSDKTSAEAATSKSAPPKTEKAKAAAAPAASPKPSVTAIAKPAGADDSASASQAKQASRSAASVAAPAPAPATNLKPVPPPSPAALRAAAEIDAPSALSPVVGPPPVDTVTPADDMAPLPGVAEPAGEAPTPPSAVAKPAAPVLPAPKPATPPAPAKATANVTPSADPRPAGSPAASATTPKPEAKPKAASTTPQPAKKAAAPPMAEANGAGVGDGETSADPPPKKPVTAPIVKRRPPAGAVDDLSAAIIGGR